MRFKIIDDVIMGEIPNSIIEPLFEAKIALNQKSGSDPSKALIPKTGIWQAIK